MTDGMTPTLGAFGDFGGRYTSELLLPALDELAQALEDIVPSKSF